MAIDAADVVLMKSRLSDVPAAIRMSRATRRNIHENLFWAFFYNTIGIPLAAGLLVGILGWKLNPMFGAAAMSLSSFCVVTNALRLNLFQMHNARRDKKVKKQISSSIFTDIRADVATSDQEDGSVKKQLKIEGMTCSHCEGRVKKALEAVDGVKEAVVSSQTGTAVVTLTADISNAVLKKAVEEEDYTVLAVE